MRRTLSILIALICITTQLTARKVYVSDASNLKNALSTALTANDTIVLSDNISITTENIQTAELNFFLDLNSNTLELGTYTIVLGNNCAATIYNGTIKRNSNSPSLLTVGQNNTLTLQNVTLDGNNSNYKSTTNGGLINNTGTLYLTQGTKLLNSKIDDGKYGSCIISTGALNVYDSSTVSNQFSTSIAMLNGSTLTTAANHTKTLYVTFYDATISAVAPSLGDTLHHTLNLGSQSTIVYSGNTNYKVRQAGSSYIWGYSAEFVMDTVDLGLPSGTLWAGCNLGANSATDAGVYYSWGEVSPYDGLYDVSTSTTLLGANDVATYYLGNNWRMPSHQELQELFEKTNYEWTSRGGRKGLLFKSRTNSKELFLPAAGWKESGLLNRLDDMLGYWSRDINNMPYELYYDHSKDSNAVNNYNGAIGQVVRPVVNRAKMRLTIDDVEGGFVNGATSGMYAFGTQFDVAAIPDSGYHYVAWRDATDSARHISPWADTVLHPIFERNQHTITFLSHTGGVIKSTVALFGDAIVKPADQFREGHEFIGWGGTVPSNLPDLDLTFTATYRQKYYKVVWTDTSNMVYNGTDHNIKAYYTNDYGDKVYLQIKYKKANSAINTTMRNAGTYTATAILDNNEYAFEEGTDILTINISKAPLSVTGVAVNEIKMYDGTTAATVTNNGNATTIYGTDDVIVTPVANYEDATPGTSKQIIVSYELQGTHATNYMEPSSFVYSRRGRILDYFAFENTNIEGSADGYCQEGYITVNYKLTKGSPSEYTVAFDNNAKEQGFANIDWSPAINSLEGYVIFQVPANCAFGTYHAEILLRNELGTYSAPINYTFTVNVPTTVLKRVYDDVIALDQNQLKLTDYQWFNNGNAIDGANDFYYQEHGGLSGTYYLAGNFNGKRVRTCTIENPIIETDENLPSISCYPNPAKGNIHVRIDHSNNMQHTIQVVNTYGTTIDNNTFYGSSYQYNTQSLPAGNYMIVVDGTAHRIVVTK